MKEIVLDYHEDEELFNKTAEGWAEKIGADKKTGVQNTQMRKFYDKVLELNEKAKNADKEEFETEVLPFVKMLNSQVAYASQRSSGGGKIVNSVFVAMINSCVNQIDKKKDLDTFKLFFEALIGFHKALDGRK